MKRPDPLDVLNLIIYHEGFKRYPYDDKTGKRIDWEKIREAGLIKGKPTIGYGICLETRGITKQEAGFILRGIISDIDFRLSVFHPKSYPYLSQVRKNVLIDMAYNLGIAGIEGFKRMWEELEKAIHTGDYEPVAREMLDSKWAVQNKKRARQLAKLMKDERW